MAEYSKPGYVLLNGIVLAECGQARFRLNSNDKPVRTLTKGLAGYSDGAEEVSCDLQNAIPRAGFEAEFTALCRAHRTVRLSFRIANKIYECEGRFMDIDISTDVDSPNGVNLTFNGRLINEATV